MAEKFTQHLETHARQSIADVCYTANNGRARFSHRLAAVANSPEQMRARLVDFVEGREVANLVFGEASSKRGKLAFLYAGQGYQYAGMGRVLFDTQPTFRRALEECVELFRPYLKTSLLSVLYPDLNNTDAGLIDQTFYTQPAMFALQYALTTLWRSWGIEPAVVMGHSLGEFIAAHLAGVYSLEDAVKLVAERGRLTEDVPAVGMMASVQASEEQVLKAIAPYGDNLCIAAINGPDSTVITGIKQDVNDLLARFEQEGINARRLTISNAFHSPFIEPALDHFTRVAAEVKYHPPRMKLISTLTGKLLSPETAPEAHYWRRHLREPVQFYAAIRTLHEMGIENFLEIGPNPTQLAMGRRCLPEGYGGWFPSLRQGRDDWQQMLESVGSMFVRGVEVDWQRFEQDYKRQRVWLPTYPFQRKRYWIAEGGGRRAESGIHPLLDKCTRSPLVKEIVFESQLSTALFPYFEDHQVHGMVVLPLTGHLEIILAGAKSAFGAETQALEEIVMREPLLFYEKKECTIQVVFTPQENGAATFQLISLGKEQSAAHKIHVTGKVAPAKTHGAMASAPGDLAVMQARCSEEVSVNNYYDELYARGLEFGPGFRNLNKLWRRDGESLAQIELAADLQPGLRDYQVHPALLDACLQAFVAAWPGRGEIEKSKEQKANGEADLNHETYLPLNVESYCFYQRPTAQVWSNVVIREAEKKNAETYAGNVAVYDAAGFLVAELKGLLVKRTSAEALQGLGQENVADWLYEIAWRPRPLPAAAQRKPVARALAAPGQIAAHVHPQLKTLRAHPDLSAYEELLPQLDALCRAYVVQACERLGWKWRTQARFTGADLAQDLRVSSRHHRLFERMLEMLAEDGVLQHENGAWEVLQIPESENPDFQCNVLLDKYPASKTELALTGKCGQHLAEVLRGEHDPLQLLFPGGSVELLEKLYQHSPLTQAMNRLASEAIAAALAAMPKERALRVLEIGAGTGGTTAFVLPKLASHCQQYLFTDVSPLFLHKAQEKFREYAFVQYQTLDIERDPQAQGFSAQAFDIVIAVNVLHATADLRRSVQHAQQLLAPEGLLIVVEGTERERWVDLTFGMTEGWWKFTDTDLRPSYALISKQDWIKLLGELHFTGAQIIPGVDEKENLGRALAQQAMISANNARAAFHEAEPPQNVNGKTEAGFHAEPNGHWLIFADETGCGEKLANLLAAHGQTPVLVSAGEAFAAPGENRFTLEVQRPEDFVRLMQEAVGHNVCRGVIYLWALDQHAHANMSLAQLQQTQSKSGEAVLHLAQALIKFGGAETPRLCLVTRGAQQVAAQTAPVEITQAPLWGLGKVIALEHPELSCVRIDLDPDQDDFTFQLFDEMLAHDREDMIAYRNGERYAARLVRCALKNENGKTKIGDRNSGPAFHDLRLSKHDPRSSELPVRLQITSPGVLDGLQYQPLARRVLDAEEVEIRVQATGLNFRDVLNALGMYPGDAGPLGGECSGSIVAVGEAVKGLQVGDEVMAIATGSFSSFATTHADLVVLKPKQLSFEEATTIPSAFMTAYYALHSLAHLQAGERVLIHSAAGGVGLAAVQLAQRIGAEIFATAGSEEKREFLRDLGVRYVLDSRALAFAREIMQYTNEEGVDAVLNSLSGEFIPTSLSVLKDDGRFIEIGKRGIWTQQQVDDFKRVGEYHIVDLAATSQKNSGLAKSLLSAVMVGINDGSLRPLPMRIFSSAEVIGAFRCMQGAKHIGKIVVSQRVEPSAEGKAHGDNRGGKIEDSRAKIVDRDSQATIDDPQSTIHDLRKITFRADATYLITGGLAGLGLLTAQWMVARGARHFALMARSAPAEFARTAIAEMENAGAKILVVSGDVAREQDVKRVLFEIKPGLPPLRGVIHSAGVLADGALLQQKWERFEKVLAPKVHGAWLLHRLTQDEPLDFFVLYSSMVSMLGSRGQANHAMANAFLDGLAHHRRSRGQAGVSIHWGAWSEIGAAAERKVGERVSMQGLGAIPPQKGLQALEMILQNDLIEAGVSPVNWAKYAQQFPAGNFASFFSELIPVAPAKIETKTTATATTAPKILEQLHGALPHQRKNLLLNYVKDQALRVLGLDPSQALDKEQPLQKMGLDSLMAVELRNVLSTGLGLKRALPATLLFDYPTITAVADYLAKEVLALETTVQTVDEPPQSNGKQADAMHELEKLSDEEAEALLLEELLRK